jgi:hypothetical protein
VSARTAWPASALVPKRRRDVERPPHALRHAREMAPHVQCPRGTMTPRSRANPTMLAAISGPRAATCLVRATNIRRISVKFLGIRIALPFSTQPPSSRDSVTTNAYGCRWSRVPLGKHNFQGSMILARVARGMMLQVPWRLIQQVRQSLFPRADPGICTGRNGPQGVVRRHTCPGCRGPAPEVITGIPPSQACPKATKN